MTTLYYFLIFPVVGALVGWFTNWLAIRMLFRPRQPARFLGWTFQGVIPRRHAQLADRIAETVENSLLTPEDLEKAVLNFEARTWDPTAIHDYTKVFSKERFQREFRNIIEKISQ